MDKHLTIATSNDKTSRVATVSDSAARYTLLKDLPLTDYNTMNGWQQTATRSKRSASAGITGHRKGPMAAWGSFDVETYCSLGGTIHIGVNGQVRQPSPANNSCECEDITEKDEYNQLLRKVNEKNGTLDVSSASEMYDRVSPVPLCWEDQLSDVQVRVVNTTISQKAPQQTHSALARSQTESKASRQHTDCPGDQSADSRLAVSSIHADIVNREDDPKLLVILLQSDLGPNLSPPLGTWKFDVHLLDKTDSRQPSRVFASVQPQQCNGCYEIKFDLFKDLQWIHSINQLYGRQFLVTIDGMQPWQFHLQTQNVHVTKTLSSEKSVYLDESDSTYTEDDDDDDDVVPVSSMPTLLLEDFIGSNVKQLQNAQASTDWDPLRNAQNLQVKLPNESSQRKSCKLGGKEEAQDNDMTNRQPIARQLTPDYLLPNVKSCAQDTAFLTRVTNRTSRGAATNRSCRFGQPPQREWIETTPCFAERPLSQESGKSNTATATVVPQFVEQQKRSFLKAQYVCRARKTKYREKKRTENPPDAEKVRKMIKQREENSSTSSRLGKTNACSRADQNQSQQLHGATSSERITNTFHFLMASRLRKTPRETTPVPRPQSAPLPIQNAVSLTGLCPASACRSYRPETAHCLDRSERIRQYGLPTSFSNSFPASSSHTACSQMQVTARKIRRIKRT